MCNQYHGYITMIRLQPFNLVGPTLNLQIKNKQFILCSFHEVLNLRRAPLLRFNLRIKRENIESFINNVTIELLLLFGNKTDKLSFSVKEHFKKNELQDKYV